MTFYTDLSLSQEQARAILSEHFPVVDQSTIIIINEVKNIGYSFSASSRIYTLDFSSSVTADDAVSSCFLTLSIPPTTEARSYQPNSLAVINELQTLLRTQTDMPFPESTLDTSLTLVPYHYLLYPTSPDVKTSDLITLSDARSSNALTHNENILIDLQLGAMLGQLHSRVQNDWYGTPQLTEPLDPSYNWQESFTHLLETLLDEVQQDGLQLPYENIRRYLSRAIGFFLFDDVEVPSFVWFTGATDDIYIQIPPLPQSDVARDVEVRGFIPNVAHALWGDPLMETVFMPQTATAALMEGYMSSGGTPLTAFPRQKTKRIWYTLFLALLVLRERGTKGIDRDPAAEVKRHWAKETLDQCVESLKSAPCY